MEILFNKVYRKPKRTLKKEQDPERFLISCSIHSHDLPNAICDTGSAVSIMAIDTAEVLGFKMELSKDSFTFVDKSKAKSAGMVRNVKVEIGECTIPVDFHVVEFKSDNTSSLLFGRVFLTTVGAVCDLKKNKMCLTNVDETIFYDTVEKKKSKEFISCIEMFEVPAPTTNAIREPAKPGPASIDIQFLLSKDPRLSKSSLPAYVFATGLSSLLRSLCNLRLCGGSPGLCEVFRVLSTF
ncbi:uncharacterized protein LOC130500648 [Raphanus sativus]|uniref:Uncharacterized protein LOC130500648 n=1 Tax=Raphanus sativus TaxID=3726 RepID=A0A9W3CJB3_RAPSA|nr:uncharacterized protein LOC130500648 [Raphanus sativus]